MTQADPCSDERLLAHATKQARGGDWTLLDSIELLERMRSKDNAALGILHQPGSPALIAVIRSDDPDDIDETFDPDNPREVIFTTLDGEPVETPRDTSGIIDFHEANRLIQVASKALGVEDTASANASGPTASGPADTASG